MTGPQTRKLAAALLAAGALAPAGEAQALLGDRLEVFVSGTVTHDTNLFRLSSGVDNFAALGNSRRSDTFYTTSAGFNLDIPVSRQRFVGGLAVHNVDYTRFDDLDYTGHDGRAIWLWEIGNSLSGQLGVTDSKSIASFVNFTARVRDIVSTRTVFANGAWLVSPFWRLRAGVDSLKQDHSEVTRQANDIEATGVEGSVSFISRAGNSIGLLLRNEEGKYPNRQAGVFDNAYSQRTASAILDWTITPRSRLSGRLGHAKREFDTLSQRNFSGTVWRAVYDWTPGGRFSLSAIAQRDISAYEDIRTSFVLVKGFTLRPEYRITEKTSVAGILDWSNREYLGDPTGAQARDERIRTAGVTLTWLPLRNVSVIASAARETRDSNVAFGDYSANVFFLRGRIGF